MCRGKPGEVVAVLIVAIDANPRLGRVCRVPGARVLPAVAGVNGRAALGMFTGASRCLKAVQDAGVRVSVVFQAKPFSTHGLPGVLAGQVTLSSLTITDGSPFSKCLLLCPTV